MVYDLQATCWRTLRAMPLYHLLWGYTATAKNPPITSGNVVDPIVNHHLHSFYAAKHSRYPKMEINWSVNSCKTSGGWWCFMHLPWFLLSTKLTNLMHHQTVISHQPTTNLYTMANLSLCHVCPPVVTSPRKLSQGSCGASRATRSWMSSIWLLQLGWPDLAWKGFTWCFFKI